MNVSASLILENTEILFFPCWLTIISITLECIIIKRLIAQESFGKLLGQATAANVISSIITPFIISGADALFSYSIGITTQRICYYACIPFTHYFVRCFVSPAWFMLIATISDTVIEAPILWFFFNRKENVVSTKLLWLYVLIANILTNSIAIIALLMR